MPQGIRNFVIIAHIDHGKSTLADRFLEATGTVEKRKMREQFLDMNPLERERGITIKMQPVRMVYRPKFPISNSQFSINESISNENSNIENSLKIAKLKNENSDSEFILNLIDTPGHVDFTYEVSRALAAVEGAILLVDATQGIQAQTLANLELARREHLEIIPVVNKIDLPSAMIRETAGELSRLLGVSEERVLLVSAKDGAGVDGLLRTVVRRVPSPFEMMEFRNIESSDGALRALVFDSIYDAYQGVIAFVRIFSGSVRRGERLTFLAAGGSAEALEVGIFSPERREVETLSSGEIGYIATGIKEPAKVRVGDTISKNADISKHRVEPMPGYKEPTPVVFSSLYPENQDDYETLRDSLTKLKLNDSSLFFEPEKSEALGRGFRAGFLGMLHMEIVSERISREYGLALVLSNPSVAFRVARRSHAGGSAEMVYSAIKMPDSHEIESIEEPWITGEIITPSGYVGALTTLLNDREATIVKTSNLLGDRLVVAFDAPLREIIIDFYDTLKSISHGFASMAYEIGVYRKADLVRLDILVAGERKGILSEIVPRKNCEYIARARVSALKDILPKALFPIALQAAIDGRIIARETIPALRKDVTGYLYGGDRTRKMKLWQKQKKGKKKLKDRGSVDIAPETFLKILKKRK
ncbi:MAG: elongation factor 4 [Candidatus Sungbacteria bacterium GWC2_49_10]|uniref:Elongation factor 4 n=2 Tax=Parcubacteria group TaxID=1794811 RepID=A0A0G1WRT6_9BACT|nr:MAG: GTP-binding protein LepA [Parcubacteria group bacterium GW2011_GWB1_50_9]KKW21501.1 MAG: GTP-binding protein LepA [Candidatus Adlerbacteria bacterium GW2011_GWC1_50_9]OGZ93199.1 MAG: elongation factor 4 [Candidatus Sungbacteria bacterium GWC2_49_10]